MGLLIVSLGAADVVAGADLLVSESSRGEARTAVLAARVGIASYYGGGALDGRRTASGIPFDSSAMVAAHPSYPFGTIVRVTNLENGRFVHLRIVDRGPGRGPTRAGVIVDVSTGAARALGFLRDGLARVRLDVLRWGNHP